VRPNLAAALEYASVELRVIPLKPASKEPAISNWQHRASSDPTTIRRWFDEFPDANVAILTGVGMFVLDIDPRAGGTESFAEFVQGRQLPSTATAATGGGGGHLYFSTSVPVGSIQGLMPGLEVKGRNSYVVAEPSVHPETAREYAFEVTPAMGIAEPPDWLLDAVTRGRSVDPVDLASSWRGTVSRGGDVEALFVQVSERFPSQGVGRRNEAFKRVVASLIGRGFDDQTTTDVTCLWWHHFHGLGMIGTEPSKARTMTRRAIRSIRANDSFRLALGPDHRALCLAIELTEEQRRLLGANVAELELAALRLGGGIGLGQADDGESQTSHGTQNHKSLTRNSPLLSDRLCRSPDEAAFVESVLVHSLHKLAIEPGELIRMTGDQIRAVASDRALGGDWTDMQMERLKAKYFWRPGKPATRYELLREIVKGDRRPGLTVGTPSEYLATGLRVFLAASSGADDDMTKAII
jgi:Bifunctional DNA primase/polymerase, N-terminal